MQINILLPYKEKFDKFSPSSVAITVYNNLSKSKFKKNIKVYGRKVKNPISSKNFVGINDPLFFKSKNKNLALKMCQDIQNTKIKNHIIEIHNRPYLFNIVYNRLINHSICVFFHNDPTEMKGSKTIQERLILLEKSKMIYCVSEFVKKKFLEGIKGKFQNIEVLYNGVERRAKKFPTKIKEVIFVGRLVPEKGVQLYIGSIRKIAPHFPSWKFSIIGSPYLGSYDKDTDFAKNQTLKFKEIGKQAEFTGFLSPSAVHKRMKHASIIVIPSLWDEPYGLVAAEAMANGIAIVASNVGGIPEIIEGSAILIKDINEEKLVETLKKMMSNNLTISKYQNLAWKNFKHSSLFSSRKLDNYRKELLDKS